MEGNGRKKRINRRRKFKKKKKLKPADWRRSRRKGRKGETQRHRKTRNVLRVFLERGENISANFSGIVV